MRPCANRIEKRLSKQPGVTAGERELRHQGGHRQLRRGGDRAGQLAKAVDDIGYKAVVPPLRLGAANQAWSRWPRPRGDARAGNRPARGARDEWWCGGEDHSAPHECGRGGGPAAADQDDRGAVLSLPVLVIAMSHGKIAAFNVRGSTGLNWRSRRPVLFWCGRQFFRPRGRNSSTSAPTWTRSWRWARRGVPLFARGDDLAGVLRRSRGGGCERRTVRRAMVA